MPQYKLLAKHFLNNTLYEEGEIVEFDGKAGSMMELIEDDKPASAPKGKGKKAAPVEAVDAEDEQKAE